MTVIDQLPLDTAADSGRLRAPTERADAKSRWARRHTLRVDGKDLLLTGKFIRTARLADEWYEDLVHPESLVEALRKNPARVDIVTFWQRLPDVVPRYNYQLEWDSIAALPVTSLDHWLAHQLNPKTRNLLRKSAKAGLVVAAAEFNDEFVEGMTDIFNETPVRQGKPFWHYGKDVETVRREFSTYLFREDLFGAYYNGELVGFIFLASAGRYALLGQIISKIEHRDKAPNNALIAKAVEICAKRGVPYLVYAMWTTGTLGHFKRQNGFEKLDLPRYYIPLTMRGRIALGLRLHHGPARLVPDRLRALLIGWRKRWYERTAPSRVRRGSSTGAGPVSSDAA
jgi:hypothetical protein